MGWNDHGVWVGESERTEFRPDKSRLQIYAETEVARTDRGWVWRYGYSTCETGAVVPMTAATAVPTRYEAQRAAIAGLGNALVYGLEYEQKHGSEAEVSRFKRLVAWLIGVADSLTPEQPSLFDAAVTPEGRGER